ncbi:MAG: hypothetical protein HQ465_05330 [Rhodospirillales bacterium]|nr:hypothetical protein [Rhodospirillales bacterium]
MTAPFEALAASLRPQSPLRADITAAYRRPETECVPPLLDLATLWNSPVAWPTGRAASCRSMLRPIRARSCLTKSRSASTPPPPAAMPA